MYLIFVKENDEKFKSNLSQFDKDMFEFLNLYEKRFSESLCSELPLEHLEGYIIHCISDRTPLIWHHIGLHSLTRVDNK